MNDIRKYVNLIEQHERIDELNDDYHELYHRKREDFIEESYQ